MIAVHAWLGADTRSDWRAAVFQFVFAIWETERFVCAVLKTSFAGDLFHRRRLTAGKAAPENEIM